MSFGFRFELRCRPVCACCGDGDGAPADVTPIGMSAAAFEAVCIELGICPCCRTWTGATPFDLRAWVKEWKRGSATIPGCALPFDLT